MVFVMLGSCDSKSSSWGVGVGSDMLGDSVILSLFQNGCQVADLSLRWPCLDRGDERG